MRRDIQEYAEKYGLQVDDWAPGDGVCRYRFFIDGESYFSCRPIKTCLGRKEAMAFLNGWSSAMLAMSDVGVEAVGCMVKRLKRFNEKSIEEIHKS